ncbi:uncharacterized protein LOC107677738 [Sinocyclocheilus anshuiensis]|uniref:uncharacterized protein LOC107677738 n=1 Tax=Sinocyclocheilus anshuiensis TaxID=1608454 RepID=UPI0007B8E540|nr:PREDICTED: uncharacterized protein LOC107677738 [Sinocyclocheilus anshuiensis]
MESKPNLRFEAGELLLRPSKWMLENDLGYSLMVLSGHQRERETGRLDRGALLANKDAFLKYACTFEKVAEAIKVCRQREGTLPGCEGDCLVSFGVHRKSTFKELYEAKDRERKRFNCIAVLNQDTSAGSKMDALKKYILQRDQKKIRAEERKKSCSASFASQPVPHPSHPASPPPTQIGLEPTDEDLLASAIEVEPQVLRPPPPPSMPIRSPCLEQRAAQRLVSAASEVVLPEAWKHSFPKEQHEWIGRSLFRNQGGRAVLTDNLQMWWYPPQPRLQYHQPPASPDVFFTWPLCLWMPYRMWSYKLICSSPHCRRSGQRLTACGLYKTVRRVLNLHGWYFLATEYLECQRCHKKLAAWSYDILDQLDPAHRRMFPAILTYRVSCDMIVAKLMKERFLGNSATMLYHKLCEQHSEDWMERTLQYLSACDRFQSTTNTRPITPPPPMLPVPTAKWLLSVHAEDVRSQYSELKARITSVFGSILKMDSTKQVAKKNWWELQLSTAVLGGPLPWSPSIITSTASYPDYLLEGLERWNEDRAAAAVTHDAPLSLRCYSGSLQHSLNKLSQRLLGCSLVQAYSKPGQYTDELIGVEYPCSQQSWEFRENFGRDPDVPDRIPADLGDVEDEGFGDEAEEQDHTISPLSLVSTKEAFGLSRVSLSPSQSSQDLPPEPQEDVCRGPDRTPGFDRVVDLARYLVELREKPCISDREAADIVRLWDRLPDSDRQGVSYPPRHKERLLQGRFKTTHSKTLTCHGKESLKWYNNYRKKLEADVLALECGLTSDQHGVASCSQADDVNALCTWVSTSAFPLC